MLWQRAIVAYGVGSDKAQFGVINQFPAQKLDDPSLLWVWQTDFVLQDDKGIIQLLRKDSLVRDVRDELKYGSDFALTASNPQNATETKVLEKDAYKQEGGEFNLPEFSSKKGDSTEWASDGAGAKGLLRIPVYLRELDLRRYELKDHLGNVRVTVSDTKLPNLTPTGDPAFFEAELASYSNYYAFGMEMPGRVYDKGGYRYGFNGKENDNEVQGVGNQQDYGMRVYDPRLGKFLSVDPLTASYPFYTPYQFASNTPIIAVDIDGLESSIQLNGNETWHGYKENPLAEFGYAEYIDSDGNMHSNSDLSGFVNKAKDVKLSNEVDWGYSEDYTSVPSTNPSTEVQKSNLWDRIDFNITGKVKMIYGTVALEGKVLGAKLGGEIGAEGDLAGFTFDGNHSALGWSEDTDEEGDSSPRFLGIGTTSIATDRTLDVGAGFGLGGAGMKYIHKYSKGGFQNNNELEASFFFIKMKTNTYTRETTLGVDFGAKGALGIGVDGGAAFEMTIKPPSDK